MAHSAGTQLIPLVIPFLWLKAKLQLRLKKSPQITQCAGNRYWSILIIASLKISWKNQYLFIESMLEAPIQPTKCNYWLSVIYLNDNVFHKFCTKILTKIKLVANVAYAGRRARNSSNRNEWAEQKCAVSAPEFGGMCSTVAMICGGGRLAHDPPTHVGHINDQQQAKTQLCLTFSMMYFAQRTTRPFAWNRRDRRMHVSRVSSRNRLSIFLVVGTVAKKVPNRLCLAALDTEYSSR